MSLRISEIFGPTIQGEGALIGEPTVFVRAGGCDYRCNWCDSLHAVDSAYRHDWATLTEQEVWAKVRHLSGDQPLTVSISGGNPAIQDFAPLIALGQQEGYRFACETQGSVARSWFSALDTLVLSPKPPSSGEVVNWSLFSDCIHAANSRPTVVMKIVIFDDADYAWAKEAAARYPDLPLFLQPGNPDVDPDVPVDLEQTTDRLLWLIEKTMNDRWFAPRILPQLHVLVWGNKRGV
ncbi:7-carboxy-7-deazaguanine synthase [Aliiroseovarius sp. xm-m-379]|uniref:7-carboxy-7-deazaguanine synthase QueE n=1 Tax=unclassified Aliiroseovarius TaxID=2623558 RepID=UPI0015699CEF|nr:MULTISPECIES: 7-carboxy-7-deazaguanine synthase QueE [unclassified Aliiroseovarius]NRP23887.1 7-carboxy-7-deazaguanine synthase [Aliiroseovarius sp. xm-m-379]NRP28866.1 7-carboxy-7-deazaguanine synthase [Aliiroseovarius sp. xm-m-314]NRP32686.1 7-carboxy-7-deazaguanine synthase [Aliiroseovarius sp. xm-a-104]NRP45451.1 7-carboxy-7-deazaguanine synthase [Aliiroseovarius sp. xm-m-378]NRP49107.1 7-carboxy-7-deazaguanine synthase [Aliiroseovarius sp. xm-m-354]